MTTNRSTQARELGVDESAIADPHGKGSVVVLNAPEVEEEIIAEAEAHPTPPDQPGEWVYFRGEWVDVSGFTAIRDWQHSDKPALNHAGFYFHNDFKELIPHSGDGTLELGEVETLRRDCEQFFRTRRLPGH